MEKKNLMLRGLPKVDEVMATLQSEIARRIPAALLKSIIRSCIETQRHNILADPDGYVPKSEEEWQELFLDGVRKGTRPNLRRVINGAGVVIHTNLGRSLLSEEAAAHILDCSRHYTNLEFNLEEGKRGSRYALVEDLLCELTGAEAALVVNNNAAAVLLVLETLAQGKEVVVSRGELVEIGGSFRIPDVMAKSGAKLVEVGATNRTHYADYESVIGENTALLLKVHTSNFRIVGFTKSVSTGQLVTLGRERGILVMEDLGSGSLLDFSRFGLPKEPTVQEVVKTGADVVTFSGDKLLGGPQAGIIVGRKEVIEQVKKNPLNRALRIDKFTLAALESVLRAYYDPEEALRSIPTIRMLTEKDDVIKKRAQKVLRKLRAAKLGNCKFSLEPTFSQTGGGAVPAFGLKSWAVQVLPGEVSLNRFERDMRDSDIPLIGRIENDRYLIDCRTILDSEVDALVRLLTDYFTT